LGFSGSTFYYCSMPSESLETARREGFCGLSTPSFAYERSELAKLALAERSEAGAV
jgi:hypothetical protein